MKEQDTDIMPKLYFEKARQHSQLAQQLQAEENQKAAEFEQKRAVTFEEIAISLRLSNY